MDTARTVDVAETIDRAKFRGIQFRVVVLCMVIGVLDGFDIQVIGLVAPILAPQWGVPLASFGPIFGAGLLGLAVGALTLGPLGDRYGRKKIVLLCTFVFGLFALLTAMANDLSGLFIFRFLTGIGLGGAMPNIIALTAEYSPARLRATTITLMFCGLPIGLGLGGLLGAQLIPAFGWGSVFWVGGAVPLLLLPALFRWMPESIRYLVARGNASEEVARILTRIEPEGAFTAADRFHVPDEPLRGSSVKLIFTEGRAITTGLLWLSFFMNLLVMYFLVNWLPTLFRQLGFELETAILSTSVLNLGGIAGAVVLGRLIDLANPYPVLASAYAVAALFIGVVAVAGDNLTVLMSAIFIIGFGVMGAQIGMNALTASIYPVAIRATGIGWALGIGRIGSIVGPTVGGLFLAAGWSSGAIFAASAVPALVAALGVALIGLRHRAQAAVHAG